MPPEPLAAAVSACIACHLVPHDVGHYRRMHMKGWNYKRVRATAGHVLQHLHASASTWKESVDCEREGRVITTEISVRSNGYCERGAGCKGGGWEGKGRVTVEAIPGGYQCRALVHPHVDTSAMRPQLCGITSHIHITCRFELDHEVLLVPVVASMQSKRVVVRFPLSTRWRNDNAGAGANGWQVEGCPFAPRGDEA